MTCIRKKSKVTHSEEKRVSFMTRRRQVFHDLEKKEGMSSMTDRILISQNEKK